MSKHPLREDKTCLNCRHVVEKRFCTNCGQENTNTRKSFYELFVHFFEDLTHYENAFWKTIRNLLVRPSSLTKEYLSGRRMSYLAPVRLYIFISFVTFLTIGLLPDHERQPESRPTATHQPGASDTESGSPVNPTATSGFREREDNGWQFGDFSSVRELDSAQASRPESEKMGALRYKIEKRLAEVNEVKQQRPEYFNERLLEAIKHNVPKAIFLYMPVFAFMLWVFHGKKRWFYFDHGIFTLHYFSFILLTFTIVSVIEWIAGYLPETASEIIEFIAVAAMLCWWFFYFFRSHRLFYGESRTISRLKCFALFLINISFIIVFTFGLLLYSLLILH